MNDSHAFVASSALTVCIDFRSPQGWLAVHPTFALEDALGIAADWLPVCARPNAPPRAAAATDDRSTRHRAMRAQYYERDLQRYAALRGLPLGSASRTDDSRLAALGLLYVKPAGQAATRRYIEATYRGYFTHGEPMRLADPGAIAACIDAAGADAAGFAAFTHDAAAGFDALQAQLAAAGLLHSPAYLVEGDVFTGRAHLPMLRWLLGGRAGTPPI